MSTKRKEKKGSEENKTRWDDGLALMIICCTWRGGGRIETRRRIGPALGLPGEMRTYSSSDLIANSHRCGSGERRSLETTSRPCISLASAHNGSEL